MADLKDKNRIPELKKRLKSMASSEIRGGVLGDEELAVIASANEFGVKIAVTKKMRGFLAWKGLYLKKDTSYVTIPERPAIRSAFDSKSTVKEVYKVAVDVYDVDKNLKNILNVMGETLVGQIQKSIKSNFSPGNHPFTIEQKGGKNKTLINEGNYVQGITYKIK